MHLSLILILFIVLLAAATNLFLWVENGWRGVYWSYTRFSAFEDDYLLLFFLPNWETVYIGRFAHPDEETWMDMSMRISGVMGWSYYLLIYLLNDALMAGERDAITIHCSRMLGRI
jgi:hypothetical protein